MTANTLPAYTGPQPRCAKCGNHGAYTRYLAHGLWGHGEPTDTSLGMESNERLHRECETCGHVWDEATVEQRPAEIADPYGLLHGVAADEEA
ncbi:hypothetical protein [Streptomyces pacificus]|uniref:Uncharacterized protein n=1 Tax=Streptomyces pacificus TaxID=2705029 RepID=A0A6A0AW78_9ACTN|nr:hypothetical protein [Streptomyces pacificus]GFH36601.1 hypothetical protein SCWH03_28320 [Streptomyces pacificus]